MPVNKHIVRRVRIGGGQVEKRIINIPNRFQQREAAALIATDYTKPPEPVAPVAAVVKKPKTTAVTMPAVAPIANTNNVAVSIPTGYSVAKKDIVVNDAESKAERAKVLKAINEALLGKPKKVGQRGGFLRKLQ